MTAVVDRNISVYVGCESKNAELEKVCLSRSDVHLSEDYLQNR